MMTINTTNDAIKYNGSTLLDIIIHVPSCILILAIGVICQGLYIKTICKLIELLEWDMSDLSSKALISTHCWINVSILIVLSLYLNNCTIIKMKVLYFVQYVTFAFNMLLLKQKKT